MFVNVIICYLQVCATEECREPPSEVAPPVRTDGLNNELAAHLSSVAFKLALTEEEHTVTNSSFHTHQLEGSNEGNVLFNDTLNTFYLWLYSVKHMVKDHSYSKRGNSLPPLHGLLFPISTHSSKGSFTCTIP